MIAGYRDTHVVISKLKGKLSTSQELLVLPSHPVIVGAKPWEELCDGVEVVVFFFEVLVAAAATDGKAVIDVVPPVHLKGELPAGCQWLRQVHAHHGLVDGVGEFTS